MKKHVYSKKFMNAFNITLLVISLTIFVMYLISTYNPNENPAATIDNYTGYVMASGRNIYDGEGNLFQLKGVNLGNWLFQEEYMAVSCCEGYDTGVYTQKRGMEALRANNNLSEAQVNELENLYMDNYITEDDFKNISDLGMNTVRIPFTYMNLTEDDGETLKEDAFTRLDWAVNMCEKYDLYAVLDLHGAKGSQNKDQHSGDDTQFNLYGNTHNEIAVCNLWKEIADHFKDNKTVAAYDLLNKPRREENKYGGKVNFDLYDRIYGYVREVDTDHMILMECYPFPVNGARVSDYGWTNVALEYHIYNQTDLSINKCNYFYAFLDNICAQEVPVFIGEFNAGESISDWMNSFSFFDTRGWSYASWTYKANANIYKSDDDDKLKTWGLYELDITPVNLYTATYEEIKETYESTGTENAAKSRAYSAWGTYFWAKEDEND